MSTPDDNMDAQIDRSAQEPAEGSRETVEASLGDNTSRIDDPGSAVSDEVPDA